MVRRRGRKTRRRGDKETGGGPRRGKRPEAGWSRSPCLPFSLSPCPASFGGRPLPDRLQSQTIAIPSQPADLTPDPAPAASLPPADDRFLKTFLRSGLMDREHLRQ